MNYEYFLLDLIITIFAYMFIPFCMFFKRSQNYTIKFKRNFLIANSIVIAFGFVILKYALMSDVNAVNSFAPALIYYFINIEIWGKNNLDSDSETAKKNKKHFTHKLNFNIFTSTKIMIAVIAILTITIIIESILIIKKQNYMDKLIERINSLEETVQFDNDDYFDLLKENILLKDKTNFMDEHIVFVLDGYGSYYYTYDCMEEVTEGKEYSFWAYNKEQAISKGYKPFNCSN